LIDRLRFSLARNPQTISRQSKTVIVRSSRAMLLRARNPRKKINPIKICLFNEFDFPGSIPFLQTLLTLNRKFDVAKLLVVDQSMCSAFPGESRSRVGAVFVDSAAEIIRHTNVKRAADLACENVDPIAAVGAHRQLANNFLTTPNCHCPRSLSPRRRGAGQSGNHGVFD